MLNISRGEIIKINLNPTQGREQSGNARPCLVLSHTKYNLARQGIVIVTPITSTIKSEVKMMIEIPDRFKIKIFLVLSTLKCFKIANNIFNLFS